MASERIRKALEMAHDGRYLVRVRAVNPSGNTVDIVGYVTEVRKDGVVCVSAGDAAHGLIHEFGRDRVLAVDRVHGA
jgi:hypothetical protein